MRRAALLLVIGATAAILGVLTPGAAGRVHACSCASLELDDAFAMSDAAFVGTLVEIRRPDMTLSSVDESRFVFDVETVYKGDVHERQSILTVSSGASCGLELATGRRAIVFGTTDEPGMTPDHGEYVANLCNGTAAFAGVPATFGAGTPPLPGSSAIGADDGWPSRLVRAAWYVGAVALAGGVVLYVRRRTPTRRSRPRTG